MIPKSFHGVCAWCLFVAVTVMVMLGGRGVWAAPAQEADFVGDMLIVCETAGLATPTLGAMRCAEFRGLTALDRTAAKAAPTALRVKLKADPCDAVVALLEADETPGVQESLGPNSPSVKAMGRLRSVCGLPEQSLSRLINDVCGDSTSWSADPIVEELSKKKTPLTAAERDEVAKLEALRKAAQAPLCGTRATKARTVEQYRSAPQTPCDALKTVPVVTKSSKVQKLQLRCGSRAQSGGAIDILIPAVQGLGDFLQARAKEELVSFALSTLGKELCTPEGPKAKHLLNAASLQNVCKVLFVQNADGTPNLDKPNLDAIGSVTLGKSMQQDLLLLPVAIAALAVPPDAVKEIKDGDALVTILKTLVQELQWLQQHPGTGAYAFLKDLEQKLSKTIHTPTLKCSFVDAGDPPSVPCAIMVFLSFAAKAGDPVPTGDSAPRNIEVLNDWGKSAIDDYCETYGKPGETKDGQCLLTAHGEIVWMVLGDWEKAIGDFAERITSALEKLENDRKQAASLKTVAEDAAVISDTFSDLGAKLLDGAKKLGLAGQGAATLGKVEASLELQGEVLHAASEALGADYTSLAIELRSILANDMLKSAMSDGFRTSVLFFIDLSTAKDRDAARKMIEDAAAPLGTYEEKYSGKMMLTVNGFVGVMGGYRARFAQQSGLASAEGDGLKEVDGLAAPTGLDWTIFSGSGAHVGLLFPVIDPLAIDPSNKKGQVLNGVLAPGVFVRVGLFGSPIAVLAGIRGQPMLESPLDTCGADGKATCWKGQFSALGALAVDVPIVPLAH